jgi:hypothetical protein
MPGGDRTGPMGAGPMTGRGAGICGGNSYPGYGNFAPGFRFGRGFGGGGRGWRHQYYATGLTWWQRARAVAPAPEQELTGLRNEAEWLKNQLEAVTRRIEELDKKE